MRLRRHLEHLLQDVIEPNDFRTTYARQMQCSLNFRDATGQCVHAGAWNKFGADDFNSELLFGSALWRFSEKSRRQSASRLPIPDSSSLSWRRRQTRCQPASAGSTRSSSTV